MTNFNPWNILFNSINQYAQNYTRPTTNVVPNEAQVFDNLKSNLFNETNQTPTSNVVENAQKNLEITQQLLMEDSVVQKYVQNILKMPESFEKFLEQALNSNDGGKFLKLIVENMFNTKELASLLNENSKDAIQKLINVISDTLKTPGANMEQLRDILAIISAVYTNTQMDTNALRELFILYIPVNCQMIKQEYNFSGFEDENMEAIKNSALSILFQTKNFKNLFVSMDEVQNMVYIQVFCCDNFVIDKFNKTLKEVLKTLNINARADFQFIRTQQKENDEQNFKVISNDLVSLNILLCAYSIVKIIFKLDNF
ncbi:hypothetical protein IJ670_01050 [bacterium]|nr:hypothetical protein [bacterium]